MPRAILHKPAPLSAAEWSVMRRHPEWGCRMLADIPGLEPVAHAVHAHHERWGGTGYPLGLAGERDPLCEPHRPRVRRVQCDDRRPALRAACQAFEALLELRRCAGTQFDPLVVDTFVARADEAKVAWVRGL